MNKVFRKLRLVFDFGIGMLVCKLPFLEKYKHYLLSTWQLSEKRNFVDNLLYERTFQFWTKFEYLAEKDPDKREALKGLFMGGESGRAWAEYYDAVPIDFDQRVGSLSYLEACPLLPEMDKLLKEIRVPVTVIQIGSSSGKEIAWLAERNSSHKYIGTDIYPEVVDYAAKHYPLPGLTFEVCSAKEIGSLINRNQDQDIIVISSGSLQYVQPEHLEIFFQALGAVSELQILLLEPANEKDQDLALLKGSVRRSKTSYTHNYRYYGENTGLITQKCDIIRPFMPFENYPNHQGTVHYFYSGKSQQKMVALGT